MKRTLRIKRKHSLNCDIHPSKSILLKHDLRHPLPICLWVHRRLGKKYLASLRIDAKFLIESIVPQNLHVLPITNDTMLHGLGDLEVVAVLGGLVADHDVLDDGGPYTFFSTENGATDDGGEY